MTHFDRWDRRLFFCGIRALDEAEGHCARCGATPGVLAAFETPEGSGRLEAHCVNRVACTKRKVRTDRTQKTRVARATEDSPDFGGVDVGKSRTHKVSVGPPVGGKAERAKTGLDGLRGGVDR